VSENTAIRAEGVGKEYYIGASKTKYQTFGEAVTNTVTQPFRKVAGLIRGRAAAASGLEERIWALNDVSFEIKHGEAVGIIGKNGAGKTTLLKILARITSPTTGHVDIRGRVGALLEVGTGFHPELTGRENIYLNGAILGMSKGDVTRKFDEIVDFSGVERFIDTPVKHYSSGMHMRLAFSVAAHLEPDILIIDEVLAVGDSEFQRKCFNKMEDAGQSGRTVLFVSHNMAAIARFCDRAILLESGAIVEDGAADSVVSGYLMASMGKAAHQEWPEFESAPGNECVRVSSVRVVGANRVTAESIDMRRPVGIEISFSILKKELIFVPAISVFGDSGTHILNALDTSPKWREPQEEGDYRVIAWIPANLLNEGTLIVTVFLMDIWRYSGKPIKYAFITEAVAFQVVDSEGGPSGKGDYPQHWQAAIYPMLEWDTTRA
jgi:lipopolysaccharide transport system ATP-binding protein